jgi:hypothetical protein
LLAWHQLRPPIGLLHYSDSWGGAQHEP